MNNYYLIKLGEKFNIKMLSLVILFVLLTGAIYLVLNYGFLTIEGSGLDEKAISVRKDGIATNQARITDDSFTVFVKRGEYSIEVSGENKHSVYLVNMGLLQEKVSVELIEQQRLEKLGQNEFRCSLSTEVLLFYPCNDYRGEVRLLENNKISPKMNPVAMWWTGIEDSQESYRLPGSGIRNLVVPYNKGLLSISQKDGTLTMVKRDNEGSVKEAGRIFIDDFSTPISHDLIATTTGRPSSRIGILDLENDKILYFENLSSEYKVFDIKDAADVATNNSNKTQIKVNENDIFLLIGFGADNIEFHGTNEERNLYESSQIQNQQIFTFSINEGKLTKKSVDKINANFVIKNFEVSDTSNSLVLPHFLEKGQIRLSGEDPSTILLPHNDISNACWKDDDVFYYSTVSANQIYEYNIQEKASYLVYSSARNDIMHFRCLYGKLYLTMNNHRVGSKDLEHYTLSELKHVGTRLENTLPLYINVESDTLKLSLDGTKILVSQAYDGDNDPSTPIQSVAEQKVIEALQRRSIDTEKLDIIFDL